MITLRPYQAEGIAAIEREFTTRRSTLLVMPTGTGKTETFLEVALRRRHLGVTLALADRKDLVRQTARRGLAAGLTVGIEMGDESAASLFRPELVSASVQSLSQSARLRNYDPARVGTIIIDEADLAMAPSYRRVVDAFPGAKVLGVTATPRRADGQSMSSIFESVAFRYTLRQAIRDGFLSPIRQCRVAVEGLDLSSVRTTAGDLNEGDLARVLSDDKVLVETARRLIQASDGRLTIVFAASRQHAILLAQQINSYEGSGGARAIDGTADDEERVEFIGDMLAGKFRIAVNCDLWVRGLDVRPISCVAMLRLTKSWARYVQAIGRGLRLSPETGKKDLLVLDFAGNAGRHALVECVDLFSDEKELDAKVRAKAKRIAERNPQLSMLEVLERAEREAANAETRAAAKRQLPAARDFELQDVSPFVSLASILGVEIPRHVPDAPPATQRQLDALTNAGIDLAKAGLLGIDLRQASALIDGITRRAAKGLCSIKQVKLLERHGYDATSMSRAQAGAIIAKIAANGWRLPKKTAV